MVNIVNSPSFIDVFYSQNPLHRGNTIIVHGDGLELFVYLVVLFFFEPACDGGKLVVFVSTFFSWCRNNQRRACFIDKDRVNFVDNRKIELALHHAADVVHHVIAQVIKAVLVIGAVSNVGTVGILAAYRPQRTHARIVVRFIIKSGIINMRLVVGNYSRREPQKVVDLSHPSAVQRGQVVIYGNNMHTLTRKRIKIHWCCCYQSFTFTGPHFGDFALVQG